MTTETFAVGPRDEIDLDASQAWRAAHPVGQAVQPVRPSLAQALRRRRRCPRGAGPD